MNCPTVADLRAKLDGELTEAKVHDLDSHLTSCDACKVRIESLSRDAQRVRVELSTLAPAEDSGFGDAPAAFARFQSRETDTPQRTSIFSRGFAAQFRQAWAAVAVLLALVVCFSLSPARSWGQRLLAMLRVQKIAVVPIEAPAIEGAERNSRSEKMMSQLISDNVVVTMHSDQPQIAADAAQAGQFAGIKVRLLAGRSDPPRLSVVGEQGFQMTLNRDRLQSILDEFGRSDLQLPSSIDGALLAVHVPKSVTAVYGQCPHHSKDDSQEQPKSADLAGCVMLVQVPSPTVSVPPELNIQQLATLALQAAGMSPQDAQAFCETVDWTSTLVLPIPRDAASYETTSVDGVEGTLIATRGYRRGMPGYSLLWVKNGIIYSLTGFGSAGQAVPLADSLE